MLFRLLIALWRNLGYLPLAWLHTIGRFLGRLYWIVPNRERRTSLTNLELCFPELSQAQREDLCRRSLKQMGCSLMELSAVWFSPMERVNAMVREIRGEESLRREPGQGLILLLPHLGCWEIIGLILPRQEQVTSLYRPPRMAQMGTLIKQARERSGANLVATDNRGVKRIYQALQQGGTTCILPDQQPKSSRASVFAPFFGRPALTMLLINRLARKTSAKVVIGYAERLPAGEGFRIHFRALEEGLDDANPEAAAAAMNRELEAAIRECPEQYQWSYKRFRTQPEAAPSPYRKC